MKRVVTLLAIVAVWATVVVAPVAANEHQIRDEVEFDFFYENTEAELVLVTGPPFEQGCLGEGFTVATMRSVLIDGVYTSRMTADGVEMRLYSAPSFGALIDAACEAFFTGGEMPQAIAFGIGSWTYLAENQTELPGSSFEAPSVGSHITNRAKAVMTFEDGTRADVVGNADLVWTEQGPDASVNDVIVRPAG